MLANGPVVIKGAMLRLREQRSKRQEGSLCLSVTNGMHAGLRRWARDRNLGRLAVTEDLRATCIHCGRSEACTGSALDSFLSRLS